MSTYCDDAVNQPLYQNERHGQEPASAADVEPMNTGYLQLQYRASVEDNENSYAVIRA